MLKYFRFLLLLILIISFTDEIKATHVPGGNITYENIGPNTFVVTLTVFEDCGTAFMGNTPQTLMVSNSCGLSSPNINLPNVVFQDEVSQLCLQMIGQSECCLLYTSDAADDSLRVDLGGRRIIKKRMILLGAETGS
mgnify:CR=1 FL=1